jgi:endonuclease/exonuclease/phosphatase family metal-dependent hydrolase
LVETNDILLDMDGNRILNLKRQIPLLSPLYKLIRRLLHQPGFLYLRPLAQSILEITSASTRLVSGISPGTYKVTQSCYGITILSSNLCHDWPFHRRMSSRLEAFARLVEAQNADIILLQEVARLSRLEVDKWLSQRLGMTYVYTRVNGHQDEIGFEEGLAVFTRYPIKDAQLKVMGDQINPFIRRMGLAASLETPWGEFLAFSVHLSLRNGRNIDQLEGLIEWVNTLSGDRAAFIGGDFNAHESTKQILAAKKTWLDTYRYSNPDKDGSTHSIRWPWGTPLRRSRLDYIFLKPDSSKWRIMDADHLEAPFENHSDHRVVMARLLPSI